MRKVKQAAAVVTAAGAVPAIVLAGKGATAKPAMLQVKPGQAYRGARAAWYGVLLQYNGQAANAYLAHCVAMPPSLPKSGKVENPSGWLRYFVRTGVATLA
jgi:hypothetical protein